MQDYPKYSPCVILPKEAKQPQKQISHLWPKPRIIKFAILPPDQSYIFGLLLINTSLNTIIKGLAHQPTKHRPTPLKFLLYLSLCLWFNSPQAHKSFHLAHTHLASDIPFHFLHVPSLKSSLGLDSPNITCVTKNGHNNVKIVSSNIPVVIL